MIRFVDLTECYRGEDEDLFARCAFIDTFTDTFIGDDV